MLDSVSASQPLIVGRYSLHSEIAAGGMATVHLGRLVGPVGFSRTVAIKRLHAHFAKDPEFVAMFLDEARLAARIQHPNVVSIIDVVAERGELLLVMDYVQGESLGQLLKSVHKSRSRVEPDVACKVIIDVLSGLHGAHEAKSERGAPLGVVHRDVSPQNILVGTDGVAHLIDFGVAKASERAQCTRQGVVKGKLAYMAPEQIRAGTVDRRTDLYAAGVVLWEMITGHRLFQGGDASLMYAVLSEPVSPPSSAVPNIPAGLDSIVMKALDRNPENRYGSALEFADALEQAIRPATSREVARWIGQLASAALDRRAQMVSNVEGLSHLAMPAAQISEPSSQVSDLLCSAGSALPLQPDPPPETRREPYTEINSTISSGEIQLPKPASKAKYLVAALIFGATILLGIVALVLRARAEIVPIASLSNSVVSAAPPRIPPALIQSAGNPAIESAEKAPEAPPVASASKADSGKSATTPTKPVSRPTGPLGKKPAYTRD